MGNCAGTKNKSVPIKSLGKENISTNQNQQNQPLPIDDKITLEEAKSKRQLLKNSLMQKSSIPPRFYVHKINPFSTKLQK